MLKGETDTTTIILGGKKVRWGDAISHREGITELLG
jgi:hypothetical protein